MSLRERRTSPFVFLSWIASAPFLVLTLRWLLVLRRIALAEELKLTWLDKLLAAAPIGYTHLGFLAAGALLERSFDVFESPVASLALPLLGQVDRGTALWVLWLLAGLAVAFSFVVISAVETYFGRKIPDLVRLGRETIFATLTGVRIGAREGKVDLTEERWNGLLRRR